MSVDRRPADRFSSNKRQAHRTALHLAEFILSNLQHLAKVDNTGKLEKAARDFRFLLANGEDLTPGQLSFLESIYEKVLGAAGYDSISVHHDKTRRSLKVG